jgi:hypothetical protein
VALNQRYLKALAPKALELLNTVKAGVAIKDQRRSRKVMEQEYREEAVKLGLIGSSLLSWVLSWALKAVVNALIEYMESQNTAVTSGYRVDHVGHSVDSGGNLTYVENFMQISKVLMQVQSAQQGAVELRAKLQSHAE